MGFLSGAGSLGSILGPLILTLIYHEKGPIVGFLIFVGVLIMAILTAMASYKRLIPYSLYKQKKMMKTGGKLPTDNEGSSCYGSINTGTSSHKSNNA